MSDLSLVVSEVFGPTVQGEGPSAGRRCMFVRLGRCNLDCAWCDTPYTWDWHGRNGTAYDPSVELRTVPVDDVARQVTGVGLLVVTGGEPMLQRPALDHLVEAVDDLVDVEVETNGTRAPSILAGRVRFNVSPKLPGSGVAPVRAIRHDVLAEYAALPSSMFKFVCVDDTDLREALRLADRLDVGRDRVWIMPEGRTSAALARGDLAQRAIDAGCNVSGRLHVTLWGDERGR